jgi:metaxin
LAQPTPSFFYHSVLQLPPPTSQRPIETILTPPPGPLSGISSLLPPYGVRVSPSAIASRYRDAIAALSECLGQHEWFLGSPYVTRLPPYAHEC